MRGEREKEGGEDSEGKEREREGKKIQGTTTTTTDGGRIEVLWIL